MRCLRAKVWRYSSSVQNCLVRVILGFSAIRIFAKSTSPSCRVELMFSDGSPASARIAASSSAMRRFSSTAYSASAAVSIRTPAISIEASTSIIGSSISE